MQVILSLSLTVLDVVALYKKNKINKVKRVGLSAVYFLIRIFDDGMQIYECFMFHKLKLCISLPEQ